MFLVISQERTIKKCEIDFYKQILGINARNFIAIKESK